MKNQIIFTLAAIGVLGGGWAAYVSGRTQAPLPPAFNPATNPYEHGIFANGIVESDQPNGENTNVYPEVTGTVKAILVSEGQAVREGDPLIELDDSVQRATVEQQEAQADAAATVLGELRAQPREETVHVAEAQLAAARASLKAAQDQFEKEKAAFEINPKAISKDALDSAENATFVARANVEVAQRQLELIQAGAWAYDIENQERLHGALLKAHAASSALLAKYTLRAPKAGTVLAIQATVGSLISAQGAYESYTQGLAPVLVLGTGHKSLNVRCYVDEILVPRLPDPSKMKAQMSIRGSDRKLALQYVRTQPFVSPKIELSNQRLERVDVRVLPVIFRVAMPEGLNLYPGQLVDVYIGSEL